jgi:hypothetical protein
LHVNNDFGLPEATGKPLILFAELLVLRMERIVD